MRHVVKMTLAWPRSFVTAWTQQAMHFLSNSLFVSPETYDQYKTYLMQHSSSTRDAPAMGPPRYHFAIFFMRESQLATCIYTISVLQ